MKLTALPLMESLDKQVAIKVMDLPETAWGRDVVCPYCKRRGRYCGARSWCSNCAEWYYSAYRPYQDDITAAMEVVERMMAQSLRVLIDGDSRHGWEVEFKQLIGNGWSFVAREEARSLPKAICRAALAVVESREPANGGTQ